MRRIEITVNDKAYPCYPTTGAMLRFKQHTGKEITQIDASSITDLCTYLWCCVASASKREGMKFEYSLMDFADWISPEDMRKWNESMAADTADQEASEEKKSQ